MVDRGLNENLNLDDVKVQLLESELQKEGSIGALITPFYKSAKLMDQKIKV